MTKMINIYVPDYPIYRITMHSARQKYNKNIYYLVYSVKVYDFPSYKKSKKTDRLFYFVSM
ncbi:hypothetical protein PSM36_0787 [Proteiniphilum saccharofermentans]|uniref:Uncharacterized protein n=1 Tax=Proteiniphilum saccharofermentans TaxID=1642647 RepID=A0A1R3STE7_9BACT|nr:hypothetical protein PSM36_0787 [Proteiniphilum saccharofermentans]SEA00033.1 hypothetical protein SAMN05216331_1144 [Porphyromonadaceae bacterium KH3R12]